MQTARFSAYSRPLSLDINSFSVSYVAYADDTQLNDHAPASEIDALITNLENCISEVKVWMSDNKLKLNDDKTEALLVASQRSSFSDPLPDSIKVENTTIKFSSSVRNLGVIFDSSLSMHNHVQNVCKLAYFELRRISSVRHYLTTDATKTLVCSFVLSRLDYCNGTLSGCPQYLIEKLQKVQNNAARLVLRARKADHITPLLHSLHWLPISSRIQYKIMSLTYNSLFESGPIYLSDLMHLYTPRRQLRSSSDTRTLCLPSFRTKSYGNRRFSVQSPLLWNSLPFSIRHTQSSNTFKTQLKTHLFSNAFE